MASDEFWRLAPRQLVALLRRHRMQIERAEFGPAMVTATLVNLIQRPRKPATPLDYMPSMMRRSARLKPKKTVEHMKAIAMAVTQSMGGRVGTQSG